MCYKFFKVICYLIVIYLLFLVTHYICYVKGKIQSGLSV